MTTYLTLLSMKLVLLACVLGMIGLPFMALPGVLMVVGGLSVMRHELVAGRGFNR